MDAFRGADFREPSEGVWHHLWLCGPPNTAVMGWAGFQGLMADFMSPWSLALTWQLAGLQLLLLQFGSLCH